MQLKNNSIQKAVGVFIVLLCIYILCFNGVPSTDDEQLYIALTESMATGRGYDALPLLGNDRLQGGAGGVEPMHSIAGIPIYQFAKFTGWGKAQTQFFMPALYTAATALLLVLTVKNRGFDDQIANLTGLIYGLGTIAFVYARMNFREPLAAMFFLLSVFILEKANNMNNQRKRIILVSLSWVSFFLAALTKITTLVLIPIHGFLTIREVRKGNLNFKQPRSWMITSLLLVVLLISAVFIYQVLPEASISRFTLRFVDYIRFTIPRIPHDYFWRAVAGLLFSPGKGLFIYSPILILALFSPFSRKSRGWLVGIGALILLTITQALIYDANWWGITWGTRTLIPALPLLILSAVPVIDRVKNSQNEGLKFLVSGLAILSVLIQFGRLFTADPAYIRWIIEITGRSMDSALQWDITLAPIFRYIWLGMQGSLSDIVWFHLHGFSLISIIIFACAFMAAMAFGILMIKKNAIHSRTSFLSVISVLALISSLFFCVMTDSRYYRHINAIEETRNKLCDTAGTNDLVLIDYYLSPFWLFYSNFGCDKIAWAGLPALQQTAINQDYFYPRLSKTEQIITMGLQSGNVYLISVLADENHTYSETFNEYGFQTQMVSSNNNHPIKIFKIKTANQ